MKNFQEDIYQPQEHIVKKGHVYGKLLYVARGTIIEKSGDYMDLHVGSLKFEKGRIACLQNLMPNAEHEENISDLYCHHSSMATAAPLDLEYLRNILKNDQEKMLKLWQLVAYRMIVLNPHKLQQFQPLTQEKVKLFCRMCTIQIYQPGDKVDVGKGGVLFRGALYGIKND